jgi:ribosomal protein S18 acetylase RimI-like enzyme
VHSIVIRAYAPADARACTRIFDRAWHAGHPYAPRRIDDAEFASNTRGESILVAGLRGFGVAGFVSVYEPRNFVHNLYVEPNLQGRGIGKALLARAVAMLGGRASLKCQTRNAGALAFYRRLGWMLGEEGGTEPGRWIRLRVP